MKCECIPFLVIHTDVPCIHMHTRSFTNLFSFHTHHTLDDNDDQTYPQRDEDIGWFVGGVYPVVAPYLGGRLSNVTLDLFTW